jgi:hypothetical protein
MSLSLKVLLNHIADYLLLLSDAPSFLFTLNTSYDQAFNDSRQFGISPHDYEFLLVANSVTIAVSVAATAISSAAALH